jgi:AcrR family transcriptional regulator
LTINTALQEHECSKILRRKGMSGMGLRETKAKKTRTRILSEALQLFGRNGYEQTTMEAIAEAAEVSPSTLYRCFLTKDLILLDPLVGYDLMASFSLHAVNLPVEEAFAKAILEWAKWQDTNAEAILLVRSLIDQNIMPRARVWDLLYQSVQDMNARLAEKLHLPEDDLQVVLSVRLLFLTIAFTVAELWRASAGKSSAVAIAKQVMRMFEENRVLIPRQAPRRTVTSNAAAALNYFR